jgi:hypothetical protein
METDDILMRVQMTKITSLTFCRSVKQFLPHEGASFYLIPFKQISNHGYSVAVLVPYHVPEVANCIDRFPVRHDMINRTYKQSYHKISSKISYNNVYRLSFVNVNVITLLLSVYDCSSRH